MPALHTPRRSAAPSSPRAPRPPAAASLLHTSLRPLPAACAALLCVLARGQAAPTVLLLHDYPDSRSAVFTLTVQLDLAGGCAVDLSFRARLDRVVTSLRCCFVCRLRGRVSLRSGRSGPVDGLFRGFDAVRCAALRFASTPSSSTRPHGETRYHSASAEGGARRDGGMTRMTAVNTTRPQCRAVRSVDVAVRIGCAAVKAARQSAAVCGCTHEHIDARNGHTLSVRAPHRRCTRNRVCSATVSHRARPATRLSLCWPRSEGSASELEPECDMRMRCDKQRCIFECTSPLLLTPLSPLTVCAIRL